MGNCLDVPGGRNNAQPPPYPHNQQLHFGYNADLQTDQFYPIDGHNIAPTAPPPYAETDPNIPRITNGRKSVRHVQRSRASVFAHEEATTQSPKILVAAIDFGTTFSGYAFSFRHEYMADKLKISTNLWPHNSGLSAKAPSAVLINSYGKLEAFGYDAQKTYAEVIESGKASEYFFFQKFKMVLYSTENLNCETPLFDITGKQMPAVDVFGLVIGFLRTHLLYRLQSRDNQNGLEDDMIQWVLTVPAIWSDKAKQFMRRAAEKGGIKSENLTLALEPEAASIYCRHIPQSITTSDAIGGSTALENGTKYLILDLGGGTVDVTVHEINAEGALQEVHQATGGCWGGATVDDEFRQLIAHVFGANVLEHACQRYPNEVLDLFLEFEMKKRTFESNQTASVPLKCPVCLFETYKEINGAAIQENFSTSSDSAKDLVEFKRDKIIIFATTFKRLFENSISQIIHHVNGLLHTAPVTGVTTILMVGGYSDSYVVKDAIISNFPHLRIINPDDCSLAVLKGAVLFGHDPHVIRSRVCKFTYGIVMNKKFVEGHHPEDHKIIINGEEICDDIFDVHLTKGEIVEIGKPRPEKAYYAPFRRADRALLEVFASTIENPGFVTDPSCSLLGRLIIELSPEESNKREDQIVNVSFHYCGTELEVAAREESTRKTIKAKFDFLG